MESELGQMKSQVDRNSEEKMDTKYGLRENPRKTWRAEDLKAPSSHLMDEEKLMLCKQCGKGFKSMKALCGHMACHSEKDRFFKDDGWNSSDESVRKRTKRKDAAKRYKKDSVCSALDNDSSSVSEIDFEQEELAMCLIMLSRDYTNWAGFGSNQESSSSVVSEMKSSSIDGEISRKRDRKCVEVKNLAKGKWESAASDSENEEYSDGYYETNRFRKQKSEIGSRVEVWGTEVGKQLKKDIRLGNGSDSKIVKFASKNKNQQKGKVVKSKKKTKAHKCPYCSRVFNSGQALGGHKRTHSLLGNYGNTNNMIATVLKPESSEVKEMLDLNLPAHEEEENSEHSQFLN